MRFSHANIFFLLHYIPKTHQSNRARGEIELPQPAGECHEPSEEHIDGLTAKPFWETKDFSWAQSLEENAHIIQEEFESKLQQEENLFSGDSKWQNNVMGGGWSAIRYVQFDSIRFCFCDSQHDISSPSYIVSNIV